MMCRPCQLATKLARLLTGSYSCSSWILGASVADGASVALRLISPPVIGYSPGVQAVLHVGATVPDLGIADISPDEGSSTVCLRVNGSSSGCFDSDSPWGALLPVKQSGIAWVTGHLRTATGKVATSRPLAADIPAADSSCDEYDEDEKKLLPTTRARPDELQRRSRIGDHVDALHSSLLGQQDDSLLIPSSPLQGVSAVLVVTLADADLAVLLISTLRNCGAMDLFRDLFVVVPSGELARIKAILRRNVLLSTDSVFFVDERQLLPGGGRLELWWNTYALQMALKLFASSLVRTTYYLTLDADVLCTKATLSEQDLLPAGRGNYVPEGRNVHPRWWYASAKTLGIAEDPLREGFGVTPAVLSTAGSMLALERLREEHGHEDFLSALFDGFAQVPERWWSEYTLYRTALDYFGAFDVLHGVGPTKLVGHSVWYSEDFETWNATAVFNDDTAAFAVVQSTAGINISRLIEVISQQRKGFLWEGVFYAHGG